MPQKSNVIIFDMTWLLISQNSETDNIKSIISQKYKGAVIYDCGVNKEELQDLYQILPSVTNCVLLVDSVKELALEFVVGYICGQGISLYTTCKDLPKEVLDFEDILVFESQENLEKHIKSKAKQIINDNLAVESYNFLFENGLPFDADNFAKQIEKGKQELCECYINAGMDVNARDSYGTPMLNIAARSDNLDFVKWLIDMGADIKAVSSDRGYTAVMDAVWRGNKEITKFLIEQGSDLNTISKEGQTMLVLAVGADKKEIVKMLVENGADPDIPDGMGMSAYGYAQLFKKQEIISILEKYHKE